MIINKQIRVMVVDDTQSIRHVAAGQLKPKYEVMTCDDGMHAIAEIGKFRPDIVFMDIVMPKMDGYEAVSIIRMNPYFKTTPIVMMSSKGGVFDVAKAKLLGFTSSILKPLKSEILEAAIVEYVGESLSE